MNEIEFESSGLVEQGPSMINSPIYITSEATTAPAVYAQQEPDLDTINEVLIDGMRCEFVSILKEGN